MFKEKQKTFYVYEDIESSKKEFLEVVCSPEKILDETKYKFLYTKREAFLENMQEFLDGGIENYCRDRYLYSPSADYWYMGRPELSTLNFPCWKQPTRWKKFKVKYFKNKWLQTLFSTKEEKEMQKYIDYIFKTK